MFALEFPPLSHIVDWPGLVGEGQWWEINKVVLIYGLAVLFTALIFLLGGRNIRTDNAYVKALTVDIAAQVAGKIVELPVKTNDRVSKGDLLFAIDNADYQTADD